jgi:hypothetical protein
MTSAAAKFNSVVTSETNPLSLANNVLSNVADPM